MLIAGCDAPEACCTSLFTIADNILNAVYDALLPCYPDGCTPLTKYVTMGNGDDAIMDSLTVTFAVAGASQGSTRNGVMVPIALVRGALDVRLRESGWPTVQVTEVITPPAPELQQSAAMQAYGHGEKMYRTLLNLHARHALAPVGCATSVGQLQPLQPLGGAIGFLVRVEVDLPWGGG